MDLFHLLYLSNRTRFNKFVCFSSLDFVSSCFVEIAVSHRDSLNLSLADACDIYICLLHNTCTSLFMSLKSRMQLLVFHNNENFCVKRADERMYHFEKSIKIIILNFISANSTNYWISLRDFGRHILYLL